MAKHLVVTSAFASFQIGDRISDAEEVAKFAASNPEFVVAVMAEDEPAPAPAAAEDEHDAA